MTDAQQLLIVDDADVPAGMDIPHLIRDLAVAGEYLIERWQDLEAECLVRTRIIDLDRIDADMPDYAIKGRVGGGDAGAVRQHSCGSRLQADQEAGENTL